MSSLFRQRMLSLSFVAVAFLPAPLASPTPRPADDVFRFSIARENNGDLALDWKILPGYDLYRDRIAIAREDGKAVPIITTPGDREDDPTFGTTEVYHDRARATVAAANVPVAGTIRITYQGCAERGICYPPIVRTFAVATLTARTGVKDDTIAATPPPASTPPVAGTGPDTGVPSSAGFVRTVSTAAAFDRAMADARRQGRPILVDFTADWCAACQEISRTVFAAPTVRARLRTVSVIRADLTANTADSRALMQRYDVIGPPVMVFVDPRSGHEIARTRLTGPISTTAFIQTLDRIPGQIPG